MAGTGEHQTTDDRLRRLEDAHAALLERTARLEAENRELRSRGLRAEPPTAPTTAGPTVGRRHLLRTGLAAAGAAATGAVLLDGAPAAAADGDALQLGEPNTATTVTTLTAGGSATGGLKVVGGAPFELPDSPYPYPIPRDGAAVVAEGGTGMNTGVLAVTSTGTGVRAHSRSGVAIHADSDTGPALRAVSRAGFTSGTLDISNIGGRAILATSSQGEGMRVEGNRGILAISHGEGAAVYASAWSSGPGLEVSGTSILHGQSGPGLQVSGTSTFDGQDGPDLLLSGRPVAEGPAQDGRAHAIGEIIALDDGQLLHCVGAGTPGTWRVLGGPTSAGSFHVLPMPARAYDSRPSAPPLVGVKAPLAADETRPLDLNAAGSVVPEDATAALLTVLLVNAAVGAGNFTVWAGGQPKPLANTLVWGGDAGRFTTSAVTGLTAGEVRIHASLKTHVVIDVVGYYR